MAKSNFYKKLTTFVLFLLMSISAEARRVEDYHTWLETQREFSERHILLNISPAGARAGAVIASPSQHVPNYYFHWVRDAALVMDIWMRQLEGSPRTLPVERLEKLMWDFVDFSYFGLSVPTLTGLGEPRYYVDGTANLEPWARPQNDGPALRASLMIRFAKYLISTGREAVVKSYVWPVIVQDLKYVGHEVSASSFDLWEEIRGDHFYTRITNRAALLSGSEMASQMGDVAGSAWLSTQAKIAESLVLNHFNDKNGQIIENINRVDGIYYKDSGLDVATVLGVLHTLKYPMIALNNGYLERTVEKIDTSFRSIYSINSTFSDLGTAIGRYPEDQYYGGNPWFLATMALAEYHYLRNELHTGDQYMKRAQFHADRRGHMSEQMHRDNGYMISARDLTWSYAAFLTAYEARQKIDSQQKSK
jgi:glucoamylase